MSQLVPSLALSAYVEPLVNGRRALVFGSCLSGLAQSLLDRGAQLVHVYDPEPERVAEAAAQSPIRNVTFAALGDGSLALREGAFDFAFIENLSSIADIPSALKSLKHALSNRGAALVACPNPDREARLLGASDRSAVAIDYYSLYDAVASQFEHVRMLGQAPFVGYSIVDFAPEGEPAPALDTSLLPGGAEEPEWFVALASRRPQSLEEFSIVALPLAQVFESRPGARVEQLHDKSRQRPPAGTRGSDARAGGQAAPQQLVRPDAPEFERLRREVKRREDWIVQLEARAEAADARADQVQEELEEAQASLEQAQTGLKQAQTEIKQTQAELKKTQSGVEQQRAPVAAPVTAPVSAQALEELATLRARVTALESERAALETTLRERERQLEGALGVEASDEGAEITALEQQLGERSEHVRKLERELREAERLGRELIRELEDLRSAASPDASSSLGSEPSGSGPASTVSAVQRSMDHLIALNAERDADLIAARWTIQTLERRLGLAKGGGVDADPNAPPPGPGPQ